MPAHFSTPRVMGFTGSSYPTRFLPVAELESRIGMLPSALHDSAAVLICGGRVVKAIEEERLTRLKHTNRLASNAAHACLHETGLKFADIDRFVYYGREDYWNSTIVRHMLSSPSRPPVSRARQHFANALSCDLRCDIAPERIAFVEHHHAHALSAYAIGPFRDALVVTLDGEGDNLSGSVWAGEGGTLRRLLDIPVNDSLGYLYVRTIPYLGYKQFDEYKVMGLAPYGNPARFRHVFNDVCELLSEGRFQIHWEHLPRLTDILWIPRRSGEPFNEIHRDLAAALQEAVERVTMHLLEYYRRSTGLRHLCLAGGVAHNSTMNGKIARSGLFDGVFVQPASHDAGCALGAAIAVHQELAPRTRIEPLSHVYWGTDIGDETAVHANLTAWTDIVNIRRLSNVAEDVASLLAEGAVVGWVQGRAEFGPRALGNRSILADPRPASNKDRINELVKQREAYRPFAPAVLEEHANDVFEMPGGTCADFMTLTVLVREALRPVLGAVTHVDGTARVQTVSRATNERFWTLIDAFRTRTGTPVLLNTSFNHSVEPIVDSIDDAVVCFLTTGLTYLVVGDYLVTKRELQGQRVLSLVPVIPDYVRVTRSRQVDADGLVEDVYQCEHGASRSSSRTMSERTYEILVQSGSDFTIGECFDRARLDGAVDRAQVIHEIEELWSRRLIGLLPRERVNRRTADRRQLVSSSINPG